MGNTGEILQNMGESMGNMGIIGNMGKVGALHILYTYIYTDIYDDVTNSKLDDILPVKGLTG